MKKTLIILLGLFLGISSFAQIRYGYSVGVSASQFIENNYYSYASPLKPVYKPSIHLNIEGKLGKNVRLNAGIGLVQKGGQVNFKKVNSISANSGEDIYDVWDSESYEGRTLGYIELPLNLVFRSKSFSFTYGLYAAKAIGGQFRYNYNVTIHDKSGTYYSAKFESEGSEKIIVGNAHNADNLNQRLVPHFDFGFQAGIGFDLSPNFILRCEYSRGIKNTYAELYSFGTDLKRVSTRFNQFFCLKVAYMFEQKEKS